MSQRDHWKKKRPANVLLKERKSWLSADSANRDGAGQQADSRRGRATGGSQQDTDQQ